jgi:4-amino-4-deoxy-L-arabinose transferase-like glycosyltransferase
VPRIGDILFEALNVRDGPAMPNEDACTGQAHNSDKRRRAIKDHPAARFLTCAQAVDLADASRETAADMLRVNRWYRLALVALIAAILYLPGLGRPALWEPDEGRYAEIAREMVVSGDYVTPRDDWQRYFEKPPLVYWAEAASIRVFGVNEFAVRLPAALFSIGEVVVTAAIAEAILGAEAAFLAALVLALSPLFFGFARFATLDPALAFFLTAALGAFYAAARAPAFDSRSGRLWMLTSAAMLALGALTKGPVALFLGGAIALLWLIVDGRAREIARMPLVWCAIVFLVIAAPWFVLVELRNPGFLHFFVVHEHLARFTASEEHGWGPWFFIPIVIGGTWPWIFFAPLGFMAMYSSRQDSDTRARSDARLLALWFAIIFVFFSIPRSKLGSYILPAIPPLAIVSGLGLIQLRAMAMEVRRRLLFWFVAVNVAGALAAVALALKLLYPVHPSLALDGCLVAAFVVVGALFMYGTALDEGRVGYGIAALAIALVAVLGLGERARGDAGPLTTYRDLAAVVRPFLHAGCVLGSYRHYVQSTPFYTDFPETRVEYFGELSETGLPVERGANFLIGSPAKFAELWKSNACVVLIVNRRDLEHLASSLEPKPSILGCEGKKLAIFNQPAPSPPDCKQGTQ